MSNFMHYAVWTVFFMASCSATSAQMTQLSYDNEVFSDNPRLEGIGFYFKKNVEGIVRKVYPRSCDDFYKLWESDKASLEVDADGHNRSLYFFHLGRCLLSKWVDLSKLNPEDNIMNTMKKEKITTVMPAGLYPFTFDADQRAQTLDKFWKKMWPEVRLSTVQEFSKNTVQFEDSTHEEFSITFLGAVSDPYLGKVYPVFMSYHAGDLATLTIYYTYLLSQHKNGTFFIVKSLSGQ